MSTNQLNTLADSGKARFNTSSDLAQRAGLPFVYLSIADVRAATSLSTSSVYALMAEGRFPPGDLIGAQSRRWKSTDIAAWLQLQAQIADSMRSQRQAPLSAKARHANERSLAARAAKSSAEQVQS